MVAPGVRVVVQEGCFSCSLLLLSASADLAARSLRAHRRVELHLAVAVVFGSPEGVVHAKDILGGTVLWLAGSSRRWLPHHVTAGLVGPVCACAQCVACLALDGDQGVSGWQALWPVHMMGALGAAWVLSEYRGAYNVGPVAACTSRACASKLGPAWGRSSKGRYPFLASWRYGGVAAVALPLESMIYKHNSEANKDEDMNLQKVPVDMKM